MAGSSDPFADPVIRPAYLTDDNDINVIVAGIEICRRIFATPAFQAVSLGEFAPGPDVQTRDEIKHFMQQQGGTIHHPVGTCKMGEDAPPSLTRGSGCMDFRDCVWQTRRSCRP